MKKNRIIAALSVLCILSLLAMGLALNRSGDAGGFEPPPFEPAALAGKPEVPAGLGYQELDAQEFRVGLCGEIHVHDGMAEIWFTNPQGNDVWLRLRVADEEGHVLGQTGLLRPGEYVRYVALSETTPGMKIGMKVMAYEPEIYHSAGALVFHTGIAAQ